MSSDSSAATAPAITPAPEQTTTVPAAALAAPATPAAQRTTARAGTIDNEDVNTSREDTTINADKKMDTPAALDPVVRIFVLPCATEAAFTRFAKGIACWWPKNFSASRDKLADVVVTDSVGGRVYEVNSDGSQYDWGTVAAWDPPRRLALDWTLGLRAEGSTSLVTLTFTAWDEGTQVRFVHDGWVTGQEHDRNKFDEPHGWDVVLGRYREADMS